MASGSGDVCAALLVAALLAAAPAACSDDGDDALTNAKPSAPIDGGLSPADSADSGSSPDSEAGTQQEKLTRVEGKSGTLFGSIATSFAMTKSDGTVASVGVVFPYASITGGPADHPFADDLILAMPDVAIQQTILEHLRVNWFPGGHGPEPYGQAHLDFHFFRGTLDAIDSIECRADTTLPTPDKLPPGYGTPEACSDSQGYHAWPAKDLAGGAFTGSFVFGYWKGSIDFLEPMIPLATFTKKQSFELPVARPSSAGGKRTLFPSRVLVTWDAIAATYTLAFDRFTPID